MNIFRIIRQGICTILAATVLLTTSGFSQAATWDIASFNNGATIDDSGISTATNYPYGITDWFIRYDSKPSNIFNPMFKEWFWFRVGDTGKQTSLDKLPVSGEYSADGSAVTLTYTDTLARFKVAVTAKITGSSEFTYNSTLEKTVTIQNTTSGELDFHLYSYNDLDISETGTDNVFIIDGQRVIQSGLNGRTLIQTSTLSANHFDIDTLGSSPGSMLDSLENGDSPLAAGDFAGPYPENGDMQFMVQHDLKIPAQGSATLGITDALIQTNPMTVTASQGGGSCSDATGSTTYSICFDNLTNTTDIHNVVVTGTFTNEAGFFPSDALSLSSASDSGTYDPQTKTLRWTVPALAVGAQQCVQATMTTNLASAFSLNVTAYSNETFPAQASSTTALCNTPPSVTSPPPAAFTTGMLGTYQLTVTDVENDPPAFTLIQSPSGLVMDQNGLITWTPAQEQGNASHQIAVDISDGFSTVHHTFSVYVQAQNQAPTAPAEQAISAVAGQPVSHQILASDPDGQAVIFSTTDALPAGLTMAGNGLVTGTPTLAGSFILQVMASDAANAAATISLTITISEELPPPAQPPVVTVVPDASIPAGSPFSQQVAATDPQGETLAYALAGNPEGMTVSSSGLIAWNSTLTGSYPITVTVANVSGLTASQSFTLNVQAPPPVIAPPVVTPIGAMNLTAGAPFSQQIAAIDPQGETLTYALAGNPEGMTVSSSGLIAWNSTLAGSYPITVTVTNTSGLATSQSFTLTVQAPPPPPPVIAPPVVTPIGAMNLTAGAPFSQQVTATDPQGETLAYALAGNPAGMTVSSSGLIAWNSTLAGSYPITVTVTNTSELAASQSFTLTVQAPPPPPPVDNPVLTITSRPSGNVREGTLYRYAVQATSNQTTPLSYSLVKAPQGMSITPDGVITWKPTYQQAGKYIIVVQAQTGSLSSRQTFRIHVQEGSRRHRSHAHWNDDDQPEHPALRNRQSGREVSYVRSWWRR